jgi:hypothetical protein
MEENNITQQLNEALKGIGARSYEIDEFEKLYVVTAAKYSRGTLINETTFKEEDMDDIQTLENYVATNGQLEALLQNIPESSKDENNKEQQALDSQKNKISNYYLIPRQTNQTVRMGKEEKINTVKTKVLVDSDGFSLYTIMDNGDVYMSNVLKQEIETYLKTNYKKALDSKVVSVDEVIEKMTPETVDKLIVFMNSSGFSLRSIDKEVDSYMLSKIVTDKTILDAEVPGKDISTLEENNALDEYSNPSLQKNDEENKSENEKSDEEPNLDEDAEQEQELSAPKLKEERKLKKEEFNRAGVGNQALNRIALENGCKIEQINIRILGTREALDYATELTGANLQHYRGGEVMAVRIPRVIGGDKLYLANTFTGERIEIRNREERNVKEAEQIFKYDWRPGLDTLRPMQKPKEIEGQITYMTYIDKDGYTREARYINNGKQTDLSLEEREKYLAEVQIADKLLREAIEEHEKLGTNESHLKVKEAMERRVAIDKKYDVLQRQRDVSDKTLENAKDIVEKDDGGESINHDHERDDDDDDWGPWSGRHFH